MGYVDWGEQVALHDDGMSDPIATGSLRDMARQALMASPARRASLRIESASLATLDEFAICALAAVPGFLDDIPFRAAA